MDLQQNVELMNQLVEMKELRQIQGVTQTQLRCLFCHVFISLSALLFLLPICDIY